MFCLSPGVCFIQQAECGFNRFRFKVVTVSFMCRWKQLIDEVLTVFLVDQILQKTRLPVIL